MSKTYFSIIVLSILLFSCVSIKPIEESDIFGVFSYKSFEILEVLKLNDDRTYRYYSYTAEGNTTKKDSCIGTFIINKRAIILEQEEDKLSSSCSSIISPYVLGPDAVSLELRIVNKNNIRIGYVNGYQRPFKRIK